MSRARPPRVRSPILDVASLRCTTSGAVLVVVARRQVQGVLRVGGRGGLEEPEPS